MLLEIACFNLESCLTAQAEGADRIELCENYAEGGITPAEQLIIEARSRLTIPVHVIIRPRGGNFIYIDDEIDIMKKSISFCKANKIDGVVFGILNGDHTINAPICEELIWLARPMHVTFHRAIDTCNDIAKEIETLITLGVERVLTSGGKPTAEEGSIVLSGLCNRFNDRIIILPGGGIRSGNIIEIAKATGVKEFHSAALKNNSEISDAQEIRLMKQLILK